MIALAASTVLGYLAGALFLAAHLFLVLSKRVLAAEVALALVLASVPVVSLIRASELSIATEDIIFTLLQLPLCFALILRLDSRFAGAIWDTSPKLLTATAVVLFAISIMDAGVRASGPFERPTQLAFVSFVVMLLCIHSEFRHQASRIFVICLLAFCIFMSGTKKELLLSGFVILWAAKYAVGPRNFAAFLGCVIISIVLSVYSLDYTSVSARLRLDAPISEMGSRLFLFQTGLDELLSGSIWGLGPGQTDAILPETIGGSEYGGFHNAMLDMSVQFGLWTGLPYTIYLMTIVLIGLRASPAGKFLVLYFITLELFSGPVLYGGDFRAILMVVMLSAARSLSLPREKTLAERGSKVRNINASVAEAPC